MNAARRVTQAYQQASSHRSLRDQEADLFKRVNYLLKQAQAGRKLDQVRALADNRRLWTTVIDLLHDPNNALPTELRASIISVGRTVQREMQQAAPNFGFLININETLAAGLSGQR